MESEEIKINFNEIREAEKIFHEAISKSATAILDNAVEIGGGGKRVLTRYITKNELLTRCFIEVDMTSLLYAASEGFPAFAIGQQIYDAAPGLSQEDFVKICKDKYSEYRLLQNCAELVKDEIRGEQ